MSSPVSAFIPGLKAVVFDMGGVVVGSPLDGIERYEREHSLPRHYLNVAITARGREGAFQRLERGELDLDAFYAKFGEELSEPKNADFYRHYCQQRKLDVPTIPEVRVDGWTLFGIMMREASRPDPIVLDAIAAIRASGKYKIAALTNNFQLPAPAVKASVDRDRHEEHLGMGSEQGQRDLKALFDDYIESSVTGMRKPDPEFFQYACRRLGVTPSEIVFLDDIGLNLKAAKKLGFHTIRVYPRRSKEAMAMLGQMIGLDLLGSKL